MVLVPGKILTMVNYFRFRYLVLLTFLPIVNAGAELYSLTSSSSLKYTDIGAYFENTSTMQCLAICDETDDCTSINYNLDTERCELTPHIPRIQTPVPAAEPNWLVYYSDVRNQNLRLLISTTREDCDNNIGTDCATFAGPPASPSPPTKITCTRPVTGTFLKIIHNYPDYLTLCEVEVYHV